METHLDGVTLSIIDRVLFTIKDQSTASQNGIYIVGSSPARCNCDLAAGADAAGQCYIYRAGNCQCR